MDRSNPLIKGLFEKAEIKSLDNYDVIGFDVDHCLAQYIIPSFHRMTFKVLTDILVKEKWYPEAVKDIDEKLFEFPLNASVCDFKTGCLLKLGEDNLILRGYRGFHRLSETEVILVIIIVEWNVWKSSSDEKFWQAHF